MRMLNISRYHSYRAIVVAVCATLALLLGITLSMRMAYATGDQPSATGEHIITVHDNGVDTGFITKKATLREAFADAGIRLDAMDRTEPSVDEQLVANSYQVNIYRARPVVIRDGAVETKVTTSYRTPKQIAQEASVVLHDEDIVTMATTINPTSVGAAEVMTIDRAAGFQFDFYGKTEQSYTQAHTIGEMLAAKGITMGPQDGVEPGLASPITAGMQVRLWRDGVQAITQAEDIPFSVRQVHDADQLVGYKQVQTPGVLGKKTVSYQVEMRNGKEVSRKAIQSVVTNEPTEQVEIIGVKNNYSGSLNEWLQALRTCEAGGTYSRNSGNGYYGAYQFLPATWDATAKRIGRTDLVGIRPDLANPG
ncbi:MAG: G5 domain-containing protein, partial [Candidatus Saccharimonas sp.]